MMEIEGMKKIVGMFKRFKTLPMYAIAICRMATCVPRFLITLYICVADITMRTFS